MLFLDEIDRAKAKYQRRKTDGSSARVGRTVSRLRWIPKSYRPLVLATILYPIGLVWLTVHLSNHWALATWVGGALVVPTLTTLFLLNQMGARLKNQEARLRMVEHRSRRDPLTRLLNRRGYQEQMDVLWSTLARSHGKAALFLIDLDGFKAYNDTWGHSKADKVLKKLGGTIRKTCRRVTDIACRLGGDEFVIAMPINSPEQAFRLAERIRMGFERKHYRSRDGQPLTMSIGVVVVQPQCVELPAEATRHADACMYQAKRAGGNRTVLSMRRSWTELPRWMPQVKELHDPFSRLSSDCYLMSEQEGLSSDIVLKRGMIDMSD